MIISKLNTKNIEKINDEEAANTRLFIDSGTNINTVQKMQAMTFFRTVFKKSISECKKAIIKCSAVSEIGFIEFKFLTYLFLPICTFIQILFPDTTPDPILFYSTIVIVNLRAVHVCRSLSVFLKHWKDYSVPYDKLTNILNEENLRQPLSAIAFETASVKDCHYSYEIEENEKAFINIPEFTVNKGDKICIYGESGQGKTTLFNILSGEIETDNVYINSINTKERLDCVFISQDTEIFDMTIRDNIRLGNEDITDEEILEMFDKVGLTSWISKQKEGLDTKLGERGVFISTGQRQRLNLIRGLIIPFGEIYLLDEPTSNVDDATEEIMINLIYEKLKDKTFIIITHKPGIMRICNKFYKFENGILSSTAEIRN